MNQLLVDGLTSAGALLLLWQLVGNGLLKPFFELIDERERRTSGDEHSAQEKRAEAKSIFAAVDEQLRDARLEGITVRDEIVSRAKSEAQVIIDRAAQQTAEELRKAEESIAGLKAAAVTELPAEAEKLSQLVLSRILEGTASAVVH